MLIKKDRPRKIAVLPSTMSISVWKRMWRSLGLAPYWVRCDGRNDQDAFHEAYDFLPKNPGGEVYVAAGVYQPTAMITVPVANVNTNGAGMENTIIERTHDGVYTFSMAATKHYSTLRDLTINGSGRAAATSELAAYGQYQKIERVRVVNFKGHGIEVTGSNAIINKCIFGAAATGQNGTYSVWANAGADNLQIMLSSFLDAHLAGVFIVNAEGIRIAFNYFAGNHIQTDPTGGGQLAIAANGETNQRGVIIGNVFGAGGGGDSAMEIDGGGLTVVANTVRAQSNQGIVLQNMPHNIVKANIITDCGGSAIYVAAGVDNFTIVANDCHDSQGTKTQDYGIEVAVGDSDWYIILGNNITGNVPGAAGNLSDGGTGANKIVDHNLGA